MNPGSAATNYRVPPPVSGIQQVIEVTEPRPDPVEEGWRDLPLDGRVAIQIFEFADDGTLSQDAWVQSTHWLDPVAKR